MTSARDLVRSFLLERSNGRGRVHDSTFDRPRMSLAEQLAVEALSILADRYEAQTTQVTPVATIPRTALGARRSEAVIRELIAGATHELVVLGYEVSDVKIIGALADRASLGVAVDLLVDSEQTPLDRLIAAWPAGAGSAQVWQTGPDERGRAFRLHAKALIADGRRCMIGSANLTHSGLRANLELGVLLEGPVVQRLRGYVSEMVRRGIVRPAHTLGQGMDG